MRVQGRYQELLASGQYASMSQLARAEGIPHARVGHLLDLLALSPAILAAIDVPAENAPPGMTHEELRRIRGRAVTQRRRTK